MAYFRHNGTWILPWIVHEMCRFWVQNVKLGKIWPCHFDGLEKTYLKPRFEVSISKSKKSGQLCNYQNIWKIALSKFKLTKMIRFVYLRKWQMNKSHLYQGDKNFIFFCSLLHLCTPSITGWVMYYNNEWFAFVIEQFYDHVVLLWR